MLCKIFKSILLSECVVDIDVQFEHGSAWFFNRHTLRSTVDHYRRRGSHVFVCFIHYTTVLLIIIDLEEVNRHTLRRTVDHYRRIEKVTYLYVLFTTLKLLTV